MEVSKVTHKLLIEEQVDPLLDANSPFKNYLGYSEVLPRRNFKFKLKFTNIGAQTFSGAKITSFKIIYGETVLSNLLANIDITIPPLNPQESKELINLETYAQYDGLAWIKLQIVANDNNPIEFYQHGKYRLEGSEWMNHFYVLSKGELMLIGILQALMLGKV